MILKDAHFHIMETTFAPAEAEACPKATVENAAFIRDALRRRGLAALCIPAITLYSEADLLCNPLALYAKTLAPDRVFALAGLRYDANGATEEPLLQARALWAAGFDGFKMICKPNVRRILRFPIDDPMFDPFFSEAEARGWPVLYHVGDPETFWDPIRAPKWAREAGWYYAEDRDVPALEEMYGETERMLQKHPTLRVTFAHFFFLSGDLARAQALLDRYPNVRFDVTPGGEMYAGFSENREESRAFFERNIGRIQFGTDSVAANGAECAGAEAHAQKKTANMRRFFETDDEFDTSCGRLRGLALSKGALEALYGGAFDAFIGRSAPRHVDQKHAAALCGALMEQCGDEATIKTLTELKDRFDAAQAPAASP